MISSIGLALLIFSISIVSPLKLNDPKCGRLSNGCELKSYYCDEYENQSKCHMYVCDRIDANFQFEQTEMDLIRNCSSNNREVKEALSNIYFQLSKQSILDRSFDLLKNELFLASDPNITLKTDNIFDLVGYSNNRLTFRYVKGFDIVKFKRRNSSIRIDFHYSNIDFYFNRSLIRSCDYDLENYFEDRRYVFDSFSALCDDCFNDFRFYNCEYKTKICPIDIGLNVLLGRFTYLRFLGIQNTFHKSNFPRFQPISNRSSFGFYSMKVKALDLINMQNIELNSDILNDLLFSNISLLRLFGDIVSIEKGLFKRFMVLRQIHLDLISIRKLMHRGIDWMSDLNPDINVDIHNISLSIDFFQHMCVSILIYSFNERGIKISYIDFNDYIPDEDFCLYSRIPFRQLILIDFLALPMNGKNYSCTYLWIVHNKRILSRLCKTQNESELIETDELLNGNKFYECNFEKRFSYCNRGHFETSNKTSTIFTVYDLKQKAYLINYILIITLPIVCLLGIVSNSLVIYTVSAKSNQSELRENQYKYMRLNAIFNILILIIEPLTLISECQNYNSLFCSSIRFWQFSQYFKIIFGEYFSNVFRLAANFTYVQFALNRLSLIGKDHGKLVTIASKITVRQYIGRIVIQCLVLPIVKIFRYLPNSYLIEADYPIPIGYYFKYLSSSLIIVYMSFNILLDILNYVVFLLVNFIIDVNLAIKVKQHLEDRDENHTSVINPEIKKRDIPVMGTVVMVIFNAFFSVILKVALAYTSISDLVYFIFALYDSQGKIHLDTYFNLNSLCSNDITCFLIERFGNLFYLISLSIYLIFFYHFDNKFRTSFLNTVRFLIL